MGHFRWIICALLFFATTLNYIDRQVIAILKPDLQRAFHWSEKDYGDIVTAFQVAYAAGYCLAGRLMDVIGVRFGLALAVGFWSVAAMGHGFMRSVLGFQTARFGLGLGEGGNFPASIKTISEWFPKKERALSTGLFNGGSSIGAVTAPLIVPVLAVRYGWPAAFYVTGALGSIWLIGWLALYYRPAIHPRVSAAELAYIQSDPQDPPDRIPWLRLLRYRQTWAFTTGMFISSPIWWMYLYWLPDFLHNRFDLDLVHLSAPMVVVYLLADFGAIAGGWLPMWFLNRGGSVNKARKSSMLVCALCVAPIYFAPRVSGLWPAVLLIGLAAAAHQGWAANLYTVVSDTVPRKAVSSVVGIGGTAGSIGGIFVAQFMGFILEKTGSYKIPFAIPGLAYLTALLIIHLLLPRLESVQFDPAERVVSKDA